MILTDIKSGDVGLLFVPFKWNKISTYLSAVIRFLINYQYYVRRFFDKAAERCPINHAGIFCYDPEGLLWFYEANQQGFVKNPANDRFAGIDKNCLVVKRYGLIDRDPYPICEALLGVKYNWLGLFAQIIRQTTFNIIDLEAVKRQSFWFAYCSQVVAYIIFICTGKICCQYWMSTDPQDEYFDPAPKTIPQ